MNIPYDQEIRFFISRTILIIINLTLTLFAIIFSIITIMMKRYPKNTDYVEINRKIWEIKLKIKELKILKKEKKASNNLSANKNHSNTTKSPTNEDEPKKILLQKPRSNSISHLYYLLSQLESSLSHFRSPIPLIHKFFPLLTAFTSFFWILSNFYFDCSYISKLFYIYTIRFLPRLINDYITSFILFGVSFFVFLTIRTLENVPNKQKEIFVKIFFLIFVFLFFSVPFSYFFVPLGPLKEMSLKSVLIILGGNLMTGIFLMIAFIFAIKKSLKGDSIFKMVGRFFKRGFKFLVKGFLRKVFGEFGGKKLDVKLNVNRDVNLDVNLDVKEKENDKRKRERRNAFLNNNNNSKENIINEEDESSENESSNSYFESAIIISNKNNEEQNSNKEEENNNNNNNNNNNKEEKEKNNNNNNNNNKEEKENRKSKTKKRKHKIGHLYRQSLKSYKKLEKKLSLIFIIIFSIIILEGYAFFFRLYQFFLLKKEFFNSCEKKVYKINYAFFDFVRCLALFWFLLLSGHYVKNLVKERGKILEVYKEVGLV